MRMCGHGGTRGGFTLVELTVAISISTVLVLAVYAAFSMGMRLSRREQSREQLGAKSRQIVRLLRTELSGAYFPPKQDGKTAPFRFQRVGDTGEWVLAFFTTSPSYFAEQSPGICAHVTYEYRKPRGQEKATGVLIRREELAAGEAPVSEAIDRVVMDGFESMGLSVKQVDQATGAVSDWDPSKFPRLIELQATWAHIGSVAAPAGTESLSTRIWIPVNGELFSTQAAG